MTILIAITTISIGFFLLAFWRTNIVDLAKNAIGTTRDALHNMRDPALDDDARERAVQGAAIQLLKFSGSLVLRSLLAVAAAFIPIVTADLTGLSPVAATLSFMERWDVIVIATVVISLGYVAGMRLWSR